MTNWTTFCRKMWKPGKLQMCKKTKNAMDKDFASTFDCIEWNFWRISSPVYRSKTEFIPLEIL